MKYTELKEQSDEQIEIIYEDLTKQLYELKSELRESKNVEKTHLIFKTKKDIARVLTLKTEKVGVPKVKKKRSKKKGAKK